MPLRFTSLEPLRERPFRLLFLGRTLSAVGDAIVPIAITFAVLDIGDATDLGIVLGCQWVTRVAFLMFGGVWADRLPRQLVMIASDIARALIQAVIALSFFTGSITVAQLAIASALFGAAAAFFNPAATALVPSIVAPAHLQQANALLSLSRGGIQVLGPAVAGFVVAAFGFGIVFAVDAASFVASCACLVMMRLPRTVPEQSRQHILREALEGFAEIRNRRWLSTTLCCDFIFNIGLASFFVLGPVVVEEHFDGAGDWGLVMTGVAAGSLIGSAIALRYKPRRPLLVAYMVGFATPLELLLLTPPLPLAALIAGGVVMWAGIMVTNTLWTTVEQQEVPAHVLSRVDSLSWLASSVGFPAALALTGPISTWIGVKTTLIASTALTVASLLAALSVRELRDLPSASAPTAEVVIDTGRT